MIKILNIVLGLIILQTLYWLVVAVLTFNVLVFLSNILTLIAGIYVLILINKKERK